jgi:hypothetical protein
VSPVDVGGAITRADHEEWARVVATLTRHLGDLDVAEEAAAEAFATGPGRYQILAAINACSSREPVRGLHEKLIGSVSSTVVFVFDDVQGGERELPRKTPDHTER